MALERHSPLPVGRYWVTAFGGKESALAAFLNSQVLAGLAKVTITEHIDETNDLATGHPAGSFFVFVVLQDNAVPWPAIAFGYPNRAGADIRSLADTVDRPDLPQDGLDGLDDVIKKVGNAIGGAAVVGGLALGLVLLVALAGRKH